MAHNLCTKPSLSQEPEDSRTPREAANHSPDYSCLPFCTIQCEKNKIMSLVPKQRGSWLQQGWPLSHPLPTQVSPWQADDALQCQHRMAHGRNAPPLCHTALEPLLQLYLWPESGTQCRMWILKLLSVTGHRMWGQLVSVVQVCSAEIIEKSSSATETSHHSGHSAVSRWLSVWARGLRCFPQL